MNKKNSVLDNIQENVPELLKSIELTKQAAIIGFDWSSIDPVFLKMQEELTELKEAMETGKIDRIKDELGDVLFVCTNLARHLNINPQEALKHANDKFENRFRAVERLANENQPQKTVFELDDLENLWNDVKKLE